MSFQTFTIKCMMNVDKPLLGTVASPLSRAGRTNSQYTETFLSPHILNDNLFERRVGTQLQRSIRNGHLYRISEWGSVHSAPCFNSIANGMNTQLQNGCVPTLYGMSRQCNMFDVWWSRCTTNRQKSSRDVVATSSIDTRW